MSYGGYTPSVGYMLVICRNLYVYDKHFDCSGTATLVARRFEVEGNTMTSGAKETARDQLLVAAFMHTDVPAREDVGGGELEAMMIWSIFMTGDGW